MYQRSFLLAPVGLALFCMVAAARPFDDPMERVRDSVERVVALLNDAALTQEQRWERIGVVIDEGFDFRSMSQSVLASHWKKADPEERKAFVEFFSHYIAEVYRGRIEAYSGQEIRYARASVTGKRAVVKTEIVSDQGTVIPVDYKLRNNDGVWFAYDVIIEGVSLVNNYRNTFASVVRNDGMEGLLADIRERIERRRGQGASVPSR